MAEPQGSLDVSLVVVDRRVWTGKAASISTATTEGSLGILPGHAPLLGELLRGSEVTIVPTGEKDPDVSGDPTRAAVSHRPAEPLTWTVDGGYLSVTDEGVSIIAERAEAVT